MSERPHQRPSTIRLILLAAITAIPSILLLCFWPYICKAKVEYDSLKRAQRFGDLGAERYTFLKIPYYNESGLQSFSLRTSKSCFGKFSCWSWFTNTQIWDLVRTTPNIFLLKEKTFALLTYTYARLLVSLAMTSIRLRHLLIELMGDRRSDQTCFSYFFLPILT